MIEVIAAPHPYRAGTVRFEAEDGATVAELVDQARSSAGVPPAFMNHAIAIVGDTIVRRDHWRHVRPKPGAHVVIKAVPGDDFGSIFVSLVTYALAAAIPGAGWVAIAARAAITVVGMAVAQAIAPSPKQSLSSTRDDPASASYTITGVQNQSLPYGVIPRIYGRVTNYHPPLGAAPYTESLTGGGDLQFLRMIFVVGLGEVEISDIKIGTTPIEQFKNVEVETRSGASTDTPLTLYPRQVREEQLSIELKQISSWSQRTTALDTDEVSLEVTFPGGLYFMTNRGERGYVSVTFEVQFRQTGTSTWYSAPLIAEYTNTGAAGGNFYLQSKSKSAVRAGVRFLMPSRGQYDVRIRRVSPDDQGDHTGDYQSQTQENSFWTAIRSQTNEPPIERTGLALIAVRVQATDQLNGIIDQLSCTAQAKVPVWNGSTWTTRATRAPAWAFADVLCGPGNARALDHSRLDTAGLLAWAQRTEADGVYFDGAIVNRSTVWDMLNDVAATGFASPTVRDGLFGVVHDTTKTQIVQHFTPRNSRNFKATRIFADLPHALIVRFPNERTGGQVDELRVYDDGYNASNTTKEEVLDLPFCTQARQAYKAGRRYLAAARLRPRIVSIETDLEHLVCQRGDLVRLTHDVGLIGLAAARVKGRTLDGSGNLTDVTLDTAVPMVSGTAYSVRFRLSDFSSVLARVTTVAGYQTTIALTTPISSGSPMPEIGDLAMFGEYDSESIPMIVRSIEPRADLGATLTLVDYSPAIFTADAGPIPDFDPQITLPAVITPKPPPIPAILSVASGEEVLIVGSGGALTPRIVLAVACAARSGYAVPKFLQVEYREKDSGDDWQIRSYPIGPGEISLLPVEERATYEIRARSVGDYGVTSAWAATEHKVVGKTTPPPSVDRLYRIGSRLVWNYPNPPVDLAGFELRGHYGSSTVWATARALHGGVITATEFDISALSGTQTILLRAVDTSGNYSADTAAATINLGDPIAPNLILTQSEDPGFTGTLEGGTVTGGQVEADFDVAALFWGPDTALHWPGDSLYYPSSTYQAVTYIATYAPDPTHAGASIQLAATVTGNYTIDYRLSSSPAFYDGGDFWTTDGAAFWADAIVTDWAPWPGKLGPLTDDEPSYQFRVSIDGGETQGVISNLDVLIDVPDVLEHFEDVAIANTGTRLLLSKTFRVISNVQVTVQDDGGTGITARIVDKDETLGPLIKVLNASGSAVVGTIDATIQGY